MRVLTLTTDEGENEAPDAEAIGNAVGRLGTEREAYAILAGAGGEYLQATRSEGRLVLERQEESARFAYLSSGLDVERVLALFRLCMAGDSEWKTDPCWRRWSEEDATLENRASLWAALRAQPLKAPVSPDGSLWSSSDGEVTALLAFVSEEALLEACPGAGIRLLDALELLASFIGGPHAQLFIELGGDWISVDRAEAMALRDFAGRRA